MKILGAIFDQDGLLFDTEIIFERSWKQIGSELGLDVPDALPHACCGCGRNELPAVIHRFFPNVDAADYIERALNLAWATQMSGAPALKPGVREILAHCIAHGVRTAVASSSVRRLVEHNLSAAGLASLFDVVVTGEDVRHGKPAPDIFLLAASRLGVAPSECLVFEDAFTGVRAAHAAGCHPVLVPDRLHPTPDVLSLCACRSTLADALDLFV